MARRSITEAVAAVRARRRALGLRSTETVLHEREIAILDQAKARIGAASRSDVIRLLIAKADPRTLTPADMAKLDESAA
ncbi:TPA: hypothetical protein VMX41_001807 [Streptococcus pyogenes]|nr:hypothetical protein [Streptococcus pyogenes]